MLDGSDVARMDLAQGLVQGPAQGQGLGLGLVSEEGGMSSDDMVCYDIITSHESCCSSTLLVLVQVLVLLL